MAQEIVSGPQIPQLPTPFKLEMTKEAASHNASTMSKYNNDITRVIAAYPNSHISYGSEFRSPDTLQHLLKDSPFWSEVNNSLRKGAKYPLEKISNKKRKLDLEDAIVRGNHKSAKSEISTLKI